MSNEQASEESAHSEPIRLEDCEFYHTMDLPGAGEVKGAWDLRGRFDDYVGHVELAGQTMLDVGTASGFLTFEAERRGATVTSFDTDSAANYQSLPSPYVEDRSERLRQRRNGYWLAHRAFGSRAAAVFADVYRLSTLVPQHDIAMVGQILVHLRDPLEAMRQASLVAKRYLVVTEGSYHSDQPDMMLIGTPEIWFSWWHISDGLYRKWFSILGFELVSITRNNYKCDHPSMPGDVELWTYVGERATSA
jgi:hypothetical protein